MPSPSSQPQPARNDPSRSTAWRLKVYPVAVVAVLGAVVVISAIADTGTGGPGKHLGGDYPAFYGAGSIALDGRWEVLYEPAAQRDAQVDLLDGSDSLLYFAYPPPVAVAYAPLAAISYRWSYLIHTLLMGAALWGAVAMARPLVPVVDRYPAAAFAAALLTYPLLRAVTGGQNTALTLLLVVAAVRYETARRWVATGIVVGLLMYKPQFGVVFVALLLVRRRWASAAVSGVVMGVMWLMSAALLGYGWVGDWLSEAADFARANTDLNSANFVSFPGALGHVFGSTGEVVGWALAAAVSTGLLLILLRRRDLVPLLVHALTAAIAVLVLPQPLFYEVGLLALLAGVIAGATSESMIGLGLFGVATWVQPLSGSLGSLPLMLLVAVLILWATRTLGLRPPSEISAQVPAV